MATEQKFGSISANTADLINQLKNAQSDIPLTRGEGWDSIILDATPDPDYPEVDRTNTASGNFSVAFGSRNNVSGNESLSVGGKNDISGSDCFAGGYKGVIEVNCENY